MSREMIEKAQIMYQEASSLEAHIEVIEQQIVELKEFQLNLKKLEKTQEKEMLSSLGKGVFIKTNILDKKLFVDVGAGVIVRKTIPEVAEVIEDQSSKLTGMHEESKERLFELQEELNSMLEQLKGSGE